MMDIKTVDDLRVFGETLKNAYEFIDRVCAENSRSAHNIDILTRNQEALQADSIQLRTEVDETVKMYREFLAKRDVEIETLNEKIAEKEAQE